MAKRKEEVSKEIPELNLGPIMNMVVILIPLLLLSVVFTEVGVINITAPKLATGPSTEKPPEDDKKPLNLTVTLEEKGIRIATQSAVRQPIDGCPKGDGAPTICLLDSQTSATQAFETAIGNLKGADAQKKQGAQELKDAVNLYNWMELYNQLMAIKKDFPDETVINITADPTMPYTMVVRLMDVSRYKLTKDSFENRAEFWNAGYAQKGDTYEPLFPDPVLNLAK